MLYLGIDQHARQITISLRDDEGDVVQARQVSMQPPVREKPEEVLQLDRDQVVVKWTPIFGPRGGVS